MSRIDELLNELKNEIGRASRPRCIPRAVRDQVFLRDGRACLACGARSDHKRDDYHLFAARVLQCPSVAAAYEAQAKLEAGAGRVENALRAERDVLAARLAEVEAERNELRRKLNSTLRQEAGLSRDLGNALDDLAEVKAENARLRELALVEAEGQHDEMLGATGLAAERDEARRRLAEVEAERDRLAQELEDAVEAMRKAARGPSPASAVTGFLARFPVKEGDGNG